MKTGLFRRIFFLYVVVMLLAGLLVEISITSVVRKDYLDTLQRNLSVQIALVGRSISFREANLDGLCRELRKDTGARLTIIAADGKVIGDSDADSSRMDNHLQRTEIEQALLFENGTTIRRSDTMGEDFLYVAKKITRGDSVDGFIRLSVPLSAVDRSVNLLRIRIIFVVLAVFLAIGGFALWQTDSLRRLLREITEFSRSLSQGEIDKRLFLENAGEFGEIAENLTTMSVSLQDMMRQSQEERNRLNVILTSVPDALLIIDPRGMVTIWSRSMKAFFGTEPTVGMRFAEIVRAHEFSELIEEVRSTLQPGMTEFSIEAPVEKHLAVRVSPLFFRGSDLSGFVAVFHDITDLRKLEQVRKDFVANVSHELKTPITAIKGFAETLLEGALNDKENAVSFVQTIRSNSERINALVDDLMTISKIELGVMRVEKTVTDVAGVCESIVDLFQERASAKGLSLVPRVLPECREIEADRDRLVQILTNLVDNAIKFTESGGVTFGTDREGERCFLFVQDTGIGVPAKYVARLGERFFRVDPARSRKMGGTGLGLAIVKHLVKAHGWSMQVESIPGKGTRVKLFV